MPDPSVAPAALAGLCAAAFAAGITDAIGGGGGLIQLPALLVLLPGAAVPSLLGTNKLSSVFGTCAAAATYTRKVSLDVPLTALAACLAFGFSLLGADTVLHVSSAWMRPFILVLLVVMAVFTFARRNFGTARPEQLPLKTSLIRGALIGAGIGFYDGFVGPGTGVMLIFLFLAAARMDFLHGSATAKIVNVATNLAAIALFAATGHIFYRVALPMGACNVLGGIAGANLAIARGNRFVRAVFLTVISAIIAEYAWHLFRL